MTYPHQVCLANINKLLLLIRKNPLALKGFLNLSGNRLFSVGAYRNNFYRYFYFAFNEFDVVF